MPCETAKLLLSEGITANLLGPGACGLSQSLPRTRLRSTGLNHVPRDNLLGFLLLFINLKITSGEAN